MQTPGIHNDGWKAQTRRSEDGSGSSSRLASDLQLVLVEDRRLEERDALEKKYQEDDVNMGGTLDDPEFREKHALAPMQVTLAAAMKQKSVLEDHISNLQLRINSIGVERDHFKSMTERLQVNDFEERIPACWSPPENMGLIWDGIFQVSATFSGGGQSRVLEHCKCRGEVEVAGSKAGSFLAGRSRQIYRWKGGHTAQ